MADEIKPESNKQVLLIVVGTLCICAITGVMTLAGCILWNIKPEAVLLTGFVAIVNYILGVLSGMFIKSSPTASTPADNSKTNGTVTVPEQELETKTN